MKTKYTIGSFIITIQNNNYEIIFLEDKSVKYQIYQLLDDSINLDETGEFQLFEFNTSFSVAPKKKFSSLHFSVINGDNGKYQLLLNNKPLYYSNNSGVIYTFHPTLKLIDSQGNLISPIQEESVQEVNENIVEEVIEEQVVEEQVVEEQVIEEQVVEEALKTTESPEDDLIASVLVTSNVETETITAPKTKGKKEKTTKPKKTVKKNTETNSILESIGIEPLQEEIIETPIHIEQNNIEESATVEYNTTEDYSIAINMDTLNNIKESLDLSNINNIEQENELNMELERETIDYSFMLNTNGNNEDNEENGNNEYEENMEDVQNEEPIQNNGYVSDDDEEVLEDDEEERNFLKNLNMANKLVQENNGDICENEENEENDDLMNMHIHMDNTDSELMLLSNEDDVSEKIKKISDEIQKEKEKLITLFNFSIDNIIDDFGKLENDVHSNFEKNTNTKISLQKINSFTLNHPPSSPSISLSPRSSTSPLPSPISEKSTNNKLMTINYNNNNYNVKIGYLETLPSNININQYAIGNNNNVTNSELSYELTKNDTNYLIMLDNVKLLINKKNNMLNVINLNNKQVKVVKNNDLFKMVDSDYLYTSNLLIPVVEKTIYNNEHGAKYNIFVPKNN